MVRHDVPPHRYRRRRPHRQGAVRPADRRPGAEAVEERSRAPRRRRGDGGDAGGRGARRDPADIEASGAHLANKLDDPRRTSRRSTSTGWGSATRPDLGLHATARGTCSTKIVARLPGHTEKPAATRRSGRDPRAGERRQSSLLNALVGRERVIVSDVPARRATRSHGAPREDDTTFVLVDTAGLRRKRKQYVRDRVLLRVAGLEAAERADVALVLIDAGQGVVEQISPWRLARKAQCATIVVLSKWDVTEIRIEDVRLDILPGSGSDRRSSPCRALGARPRAPACMTRGVRALRRPDHDRGAQPRAAGAARGTPSARPQGRA